MVVKACFLPSYLEFCSLLPPEELDKGSSLDICPLVEEDPFSPACLRRLAWVTMSPGADSEKISYLMRALSRLSMKSGPKALKTLIDFTESLPNWFASTPSIRGIIESAEKAIEQASESTVGSAAVTNVQSQAHLTCVIKKTSGYSHEINQIVTVFNAYLVQTGERVGRCLFNILPFYRDCDDSSYHSRPVAAIIRIDSFARRAIKGVGTALMQAVIEEGMFMRTGGKIALHSGGAALGFYAKLGFQPGYTNPLIETAIQQELRQAFVEQREPKDLLNGDALSMILPATSIRRWAAIIDKSPVLH